MSSPSFFSPYFGEPDVTEPVSPNAAHDEVPAVVEARGYRTSWDITGAWDHFPTAVVSILNVPDDITTRQRKLKELWLKDVDINEKGIFINWVVSFAHNDWGNASFSPYFEHIILFARYLEWLEPETRIIFLRDVCKFQFWEIYQTDDVVDWYVVWTYFFEEDGTCSCTQTPYSEDFNIREGGGE